MIEEVTDIQLAQQILDEVKGTNERLDIIITYLMPNGTVNTGTVEEGGQENGPESIQETPAPGAGDNVASLEDISANVGQMLGVLTRIEPQIANLDDNFTATLQASDKSLQTQKVGVSIMLVLALFLGLLIGLSLAKTVWRKL